MENMKEAVYNTAAYFKYDYKDNWIIDPFVEKMIQDVDRSTVLDSGVIDQPYSWKNTADRFIWRGKDLDFCEI